MKRMRTSVRFRIYKETRREFAKRYPAAFPARGRRPPLKVGILKDILRDDSHGIPAGRVRIFLSIWTRSTSYLTTLSKAADRVGIDGNPCQPILRRHAEEARESVESRRKSRSGV